MTLDVIKDHFLTGVMAVLCLCMLVCLIRTFVGPRISDRIVGVNMIGTQVMIFICALSVFLGEDGLTDVAVIYSMLSFLAVVIVTKLCMNAYHHGKVEKTGEKERVYK